MKIYLTVGDIIMYYDYPLIFLATDKDLNNYICSWWREVGEEPGTLGLEYLCVKVSPEALLEYVSNQKDLRDTYNETSKENFHLADTRNEDFFAEKVDYNSLNPENLPRPGSFHS